MKNESHNKKELSQRELNELISILKNRFELNMNRHQSVVWIDVEKKLKKNPSKLWSLNEMEKSGGEPDVTVQLSKIGEYIFVDCSIESPKGRRSLCYDREALEARKEHKPSGSVIEMANEIGIEILTEEDYRELQKLGKFDLKTSSWVKTPTEIRKLGGAIFCDRRYDAVFTYHNGAESYYAARGFRGMLKV